MLTAFGSVEADARGNSRERMPDEARVIGQPNCPNSRNSQNKGTLEPHECQESQALRPDEPDRTNAEALRVESNTVTMVSTVQQRFNSVTELKTSRLCLVDIFP